MEKLDFLINYLANENSEANVKKIPYDIQSKKKLYRMLCNVRKPNAISEKYIEIENEFLKEENNKKGIVYAKDIAINVKYKKVEISLWKGDITTLKVDAIVNAANSQGLGCFIPCHRCIDNAIHSASGVNLRLECNQIMKKIKTLEIGQAFITSGYNLPSTYVIHTVGPYIYKNVSEEDILKLKEAYISSLQIAKENNVKTIAFPCISTGEFHFPKDLASKIAIQAVEEYLNINETCFEKIIFNVFSEEDYNIYLKNLGDRYAGI